MKGRSAGDGSDGDGSLLLRVIAHAAGRFPPAQAAALVRDLLKVAPALMPQDTLLRAATLQGVFSKLFCEAHEGW